jgi:hypothetical protein
MKVSKVIAKVEKRLGQKGIVTRQGSKFYIQHGGYVASFYGSDDGLSGPCNDDKSIEELDASSFHVRRENDHTDLHTDYFAGTYLDNASQMVDWISPPGSKFAVGQLVRAKSNKRMTRYSLAGDVGIVTNTGNKSCKVQWTADPARNTGFLADRDLELLSAG